MMKRIMTNRVTALALAALPLTAAPAFADAPGRSAQAAANALSLNVADATLSLKIGHGDYRSRHGRHYRTNQWGQSRHEVRQLRRDARQRCARAIKRQGYRAGFRDIDFDDDIATRQIGPYGFRVHFEEVEFEARRRDRERDVTCTVRRGNVVDLAGLPHPGRRGYHNRRHDRWDDDHRYDRDHHRGGRGRGY